MSALSSPDLDTAGSLLVEEHTEYRLDDGDHERFAHYVGKGALEQAILSGVPCVALCGKKWLPQRDPQRFPVCPDCKAIYDGMPSGDDSSDGSGTGE